MNYKYLEKEYRDDVIAEALYSRERELFNYELDLENFRLHLNSLPEEAKEQRALFEGRIAQTQAQMTISQGIYNALVEQAKKDPTGHADALARAAAKRQKK